MSNGLFLTPVELADFLSDCEKDENGNLVYGKRAQAIIDHAIERAQRERADRTNLNDEETLTYYIGKMTLVMTQHPDWGKKRVSKKIGLGERTVGENDRLNDTYNNLKRMLSNAAPATLNNDPDSYIDNDD